MSTYQIEVKDILKSEGLSKKIKAEVELEPLVFREEALDLKLVEIDLDLTNVGLGVLVKGKVRGVLIASCTRCLDKFEHPLIVHLEELFTKGKVGGEKEKLVIANEKIDIGPLIDQSIILGIPIKLLCQDDCKGLCPSCGQNLNKEPCVCKEIPIDIRWTKLKDYFKKK